MYIVLLLIDIFVSMSDNYQAVYDAVRSRFHCSINGDEIANSITSQFFAASQGFLQASWDAQYAEQEKARPSVLFHPILILKNDQWQATYSEFIFGIGNSPDEAMRAFDTAWKIQAELKR